MDTHGRHAGRLLAPGPFPFWLMGFIGFAEARVLPKWPGGSCVVVLPRTTHDGDGPAGTQQNALMPRLMSSDAIKPGSLWWTRVL